MFADFSNDEFSDLSGHIERFSLKMRQHFAGVKLPAMHEYRRLAAREVLGGFDTVVEKTVAGMPRERALVVLDVVAKLKTGKGAARVLPPVCLQQCQDEARATSFARWRILPPPGRSLRHG